MNNKKPHSNYFNPFSGSRLCRDIRNDLSRCLMTSISSTTLEPCRALKKRYLGLNLQNFMRDYIEERMNSYEIIINRINEKSAPELNTYEIAVLLWNQRLFFEVHEWLENHWYDAKGDEKEILQALIRAAGTYVHLSYGRDKGAQKMSARAIITLRKHKETLPEYLHVDVMIKHLNDLTLPPPVLDSLHLNNQK